MLVAVRTYLGTLRGAVSFNDGSHQPYHFHHHAIITILHPFPGMKFLWNHIFLDASLKQLKSDRIRSMAFYGSSNCIVP